MRSFRLGVVGLILAALIAGCGGEEAVETTMPTTPPVASPEMEQMKKDMDKRFHTYSFASKAPARNRKK